MKTAAPDEWDLASVRITIMQRTAGASGSIVTGTVSKLAALAAAVTTGETLDIARRTLADIDFRRSADNRHTDRLASDPAGLVGHLIGRMASGDPKRGLWQ